jgi:hypothetical protein
MQRRYLAWSATRFFQIDEIIIFSIDPCFLMIVYQVITIRIIIMKIMYGGWLILVLLLLFA